MSDVLDGFVFGVVIGALVLSILVNVFLYFQLPGLIVGIIDEYLGGKKPNRGSRPVEGLAGITQNPIIGGAIKLFGSAPTGGGSPSEGAEPRSRTKLSDWLRR